MRIDAEPSCRSCPTRRSCPAGDREGAVPEVAGWRLAGMAAAYFLLPLAAGIAAAAAVRPGSARVVAGLAAMAGGLIAAAVGGALLRRRTAT